MYININLYKSNKFERERETQIKNWKANVDWSYTYLYWIWIWIERFILKLKENMDFWL